MKALKFGGVFIINFLISIGFISIISLSGNAQNLPPQEVETSVGKIAKLVEDNYVFAEKGKKIGAHFLSEHKAGKFKGAKDWRAFGKIATEVLRSFSGDGHLFVDYNPQRVSELLRERTDTTDAETQSAFFYGEKARENNYGFSEVKIMDGNLGYLKLSQINISEKSLPVLIAAMRFVAGTKALIVDLRDNGGGGSEIGAVLESFFLPKNISLLEFKSRNGTIEISKTVAWLIEKKYDAPVFIVVNKKTASAAEAFAFALQSKKRAKVVGQPSAGGANMASWYPVNEFIYLSVSTAAPVLPGTETSWEGVGVQPDLIAAPGEEIRIIERTIKAQK